MRTQDDRNANLQQFVRGLIWVIWLLGPASYGTVLVVGFWDRWFRLGDADPGPDLRTGCLLLWAHLVAGGGMVGLLLTRGPHWRAAEFWVLLLYWLGLAAWVLPALLSSPDHAVDPRFAWICMWVCAGAAALMPAVWVGKRVAGRGTRAQSG